MRLLINHLTRMTGPRICIAGLAHGQAHVRPIPTDGGLIRSQIPALWKLGRIVEIGNTQSIGAAPRFEDRTFRLANVSLVENLSAGAFWDRLLGRAEQTLVDVFGDDFNVNQNRKGFVAPGHGAGSLGILVPHGTPLLYEDAEGKPRLRFDDGDDVTVDCSITDTRLRRPDNVTPIAGAIEELQSLLASSDEILLSVGLTHVYPPSDPKHWLQVNNIHCSDEPLWRAN
jgi:hypothetical protein